MSRILNIIAIPFKGIAALFAFLFIFIGTWFEPGPPKPEIKKGEFPFTLVYEIDGETITVEDTLVCKFKMGANEGIGKYRDWKTSLKSKKKRITLYADDEIEVYVMPNTSNAGAYLMGDAELCDALPEGYPYAWETTDFDSKNSVTTTIKDSLEKELAEFPYSDVKAPVSAERLMEKYHIRIVSFEIAPPIENTFK